MTGGGQGPSAEKDAPRQILIERLAETLAEQRCNGLHPEDGGTCYRCREWAGIETRAMFDRYAEPSPLAGLADHFAAMCGHDAAEPHQCSTLIAAHDAARIVSPTRDLPPGSGGPQ